MNSQPRLDCLRKQMEQKGLEALLITTPENRRYMSGFSGSSGLLFVTATGCALVTDGRYWAQADRECPQVELVRFRAEEHTSLLHCGVPWLGSQGTLGIEGRNLVAADFLTLQQLLPSAWKVEPVQNLVEELRQLKDAEEVERIREACSIADRALLKALPSLKEGIQERDFCLELEYQMQKLGARKPAFDSIVASGPNGAYPHAGVTERRIQSGELITLDFGAYCNGYNSDITRTLWLGRLGERNTFLYQSVREAQARAVEAVAPGKTCKDIDAVARQHLASLGLGEYFSHGLGHGLGMAVHELPGVRSTSDTILQPGMVITIEPGVYIPGETGCRVEDSVLVTAQGYEKLTRSPYQNLQQTHPLEAVDA